MIFRPSAKIKIEKMNYMNGLGIESDASLYKYNLTNLYDTKDKHYKINMHFLRFLREELCFRLRGRRYIPGEGGKGGDGSSGGRATSRACQ